MSYLVHAGAKHRSGRYKEGTGETPYERCRTFLASIKSLESQGLSEKEIADGFGMTIRQFRAKKSEASAERKKGDISLAVRLKEKGWSEQAISERLGVSVGTVKNYLNPSAKQRTSVLETTKDAVRSSVDGQWYIDVGVGSESFLGISRTRLQNAVKLLEEEGYVVHNVNVQQIGMPVGTKTRIMVVCPPGTTYKDVVTNMDKIKTIGAYSEDGGETYTKIKPPVSVNSKRLQIVYAEEGGTQKDGVVELRPGVDDLFLGDSKYAQVRIAVDGTHYIKGMAVYADDLPEGVDIRFNTNKHVGTPIMSDDSKATQVLKKMKSDPDNPFGSAIARQNTYTSKDGTEHQGVLNIVREEGDWEKWSKTLASQVLSKQHYAVAEKQLKLMREKKESEFDEIMSLTNAAVRKKLLDSFSDDCDAAAVHLKAAALPRQSSYVILPVTSMKENEIYAPRYNDGETVVLIRYPHGGKFEIPTLKVNNKQQDAKKMLGQAKDAVGINSKVAEILSGADFDGDTVLVIPNNSGTIKTSSPLKGLQNFDPKEQYKLPPEAPRMKSKTTQTEMGKISNLITDMTIRGASEDELCRAVRHSMVVIDAEKHHLDYKQSFKDNRIAELKVKYQGSAEGGASTLISRASSEIRIPKQKEGAYVTDPATGKTRRLYIDPTTGKKLYSPANETYEVVKKNEDGTYTRTGKFKTRDMKVSRMSQVDDASVLSSGTRIEAVYATHANSLKALANKARLAYLNTENTPYNPEAKRAYQTEVDSLKAKLALATKNKPLERQAQLIANKIVAMTKEDNPDMDKDDIKKLNNRALTTARARTGADKYRIQITPKEWEAIQAGAVSNNTLTQILNSTDLDKVKEYATPRQEKGLSSSQLSRAKTMLSNDYTQAEVAEALGISTSTLIKALD